MNDEMLGVFPMWRRRRFDPRERLCFVLMPLRKETDEVFRTGIAPAVRSVGLDPECADQSFGLEIIEDIWAKINEARVVIADLTGRNPNVFYEVGIAHCLGKHTILLSANRLKNLPFDVRGLRTIHYDRVAGLGKLREEIERYLRDFLDKSPFGNELVRVVHDRARFWVERFCDPLSLAPESLLPDIRRYVRPDLLDDIAVAFCLATSAHYGSIDNAVYWGRECRKRKEAARQVAHAMLKGHRRPKYRVARVVEQFPDDVRRGAVRTLIEHEKRLVPGLIDAIESATVTDYVRENRGGDLDESLRAVLLREFIDLVL